jgi:hypothetical protein
MACGHTVESFSYSRVSHPCPACAKVGRAERRLVEKGKSVELTIWLLQEGVTVSKARPDGAIAKAVQTKIDEVVQWEHLEDRKIKEENTETLKEQTHADNRILTLLDDMPGM